MVGACSTHDNVRNAYKILIDKPEGRKDESKIVPVLN